MLLENGGPNSGISHEPPTIHVLVTGGSGFVGSWIVRVLSETHPDWMISVVDLQPEDDYQPPVEASFATKHPINYIQVDIRSAQEVVRGFKAAHKIQPIDAVLHTAGIVPGGNERYTHRNKDAIFAINVTGTENVLAATRALDIRVFVLTSSVTVVSDDMYHEHPNMDEREGVGNATWVYGQSKGVAETITLNANNPPELYTCAIRPSLVFGPGDNNMIPYIHNCIVKHETPFCVGDGCNLYDFTYVTNIADAHILAVENLLWHRDNPGSNEKDGPNRRPSAAGEAFFITNGEPVPFRTFMLAIWAHFDHIPPFTITIPTRVAWFLGYVAEWYTWLTGANASLSRGSVKDAVITAYANGSKAQRILGYEPKVSITEGLKLACDEYKERLKVKEKALNEPVERYIRGSKQPMNICI